MDGILEQNLNLMKKSVLRRDEDCFIIVDGRERGGKSTLAAQIAKYLDPTYDITRCCFTADQFYQAVKHATKGQAVVFDETMGYLASRSALSKFNKTLIKLMSEMGFKNLFVIMCIPSYFELDKYAAIHRSTCLIHIYKDMKTGKKGRYVFFDNTKKRIMYLKGKKTYDYHVIAGNFFGVFTKYFPLDMETYTAKKKTAVFYEEATIGKKEMRFKKQRDALFVILTDMGISQTKISEMMGEMGCKVSQDAISLGITNYEAERPASSVNLTIVK